MAITNSETGEPSLHESPARTATNGRPGVALRWCLGVLVLLPVFYLVALISKYGVNVPYADEFPFTPFLVKAHEHAITWGDLFRQHNEHRYFFPRLMLIGFASMAHGNLRAEMFFSVFLTVLVSVNLWFLVRRTIAGSVGQSLLLVFLFNLLLFSPVQAENWTWGFQFPLFLCNFLFSCALLAAASNFSLGRKFAICVFLALVATFSFGGGVLLWALTFPLALLIEKELTWKSRFAWGIAWGAAGAAAIALYFFQYVKPSGHPNIAASRNPMDYFLYVSTFLGAHLSRAARGEPILQAVLVGSVLLILWSAGVAYAFRHRSDPQLTRRLLPWLALGGYAILNALLAAAARIGFGINQALDSRYTTFSLYLSVAAVGLFAILRQDHFSRSGHRRFERGLLRLETILLTAFAAFSITAFSFGRTFMKDSQRTRLLGKGALIFSNVMESGEIHDRFLMANAPEARAYANMLDSIGLLHPPMMRTAEISKLNAKDQRLNGAEPGFLDYVTVSGYSCVAVGWAVLPKTRSRADCIVLSYEDPVRGPIAFRIADEIQSRPDVAAVIHEPAAEDSGWVCHFDRSVLPAGSQVLRAWALDANRAILYQLGTPQVLP